MSSTDEQELEDHLSTAQHALEKMYEWRETAEAELAAAKRITGDTE